MRKKLTLVLGIIFLLSGCGDIYVPKTIERTEFEADSSDQEIEAIKERVKREYEESKNDKRYPVAIGYESGEPKWGYVNDKGGLVIGPVYDSASFFVDGLAAVSAEGESFFIDVQGDVVIDEGFLAVSDFYDGYAVYEREVDDNILMGFVTSTGLTTDYPGYRTHVDEYSEGKAVVYNDDGYSFMSIDGSLLTENMYERVMPFSEGMALVTDGDDYGYINQLGELAVPMDYAYSESGTSYYQGFHNGLAAVKIGGAYGYINNRGEVIIEPSFDYGSVFSDRRASVDVGPIDYYINTSGEKPFETEYRYASSFQNGYAFVQYTDTEIESDQEENLHFKLINTKGEVVVGLNIEYNHGSEEKIYDGWTKILDEDIARLIYHDEEGRHFAYIDLDTSEIIWEQ